MDFWLIIYSLEALQKWRDKKGSEATYGSLLKIFIETGYKTVAHSICEVLENKCMKCKYIAILKVYNLHTLLIEQVKRKNYYLLKQLIKLIAKCSEITRRHAHSVFVGPPGSGKSSCIDRLLH